MNFRVKSLIQTIFGLLPGSEYLNYFAQKHISGNLPPDSAQFEQIFGAANLHHSVFGRYGKGMDSVVYELGCGWHLGMALVLSSLGYKDIIALDTVCHARAELINSIISHMKAGGIIPDDTEFLSNTCSMEELKSHMLGKFGINYLAPCDSADTGLSPKSIDCIYSHAVFEHIPPDYIPGILAECRRILKPDGVMSVVIDYADHYRTFDKKVTAYNFLRYSDKEWKKYNPPLHYVNRLRHRDFVDYFEKAGFKIADVTVFRSDNAEEILRNFPIANEFTAKYTLEELCITHANFILLPTTPNS